MKRKIFLLAVLFYGTYHLSAQEDPYLLWQTTDPLGYSGFVIHPNGNIIANRNCEFFEIDGNTGQLLRAFPVHDGFTTILSVSQSSDGKYFAAIYAGGGNSVLIFITDYETGEVYRELKNIGDNLDFFPDSRHILLTTFLQGTEDKSLQMYNIENESFVWHGAGFKTEGFEHLNISDDGKYFATGGRSYGKDDNGEIIYNVHLRLWDATTMKPIKELAEIGGNFEVRSIKFSPDGKYVGFQVGFMGVFIYKIDDYSLLTNIIGGGLSFSYENLVAYYASNYPNPTTIDIRNIQSNELLFSYDSVSMGSFRDTKFNSQNKTLVYGGGILRALDLNKIFTTVSEQKEVSIIKVNYNKSMLFLSDLNSISGQLNITISDITGRVIRKLDSPVSNSELRIPLKIPNGTYLIHIQDGNQEYTSKFLVVE